MTKANIQYYVDIGLYKKKVKQAVILSKGLGIGIIRKIVFRFISSCKSINKKKDRLCRQSFLNFIIK
jgi:hypothetical protein